MSVQDNKATVRRFYEEVWGKGNVDVADEIFAQEYVRHDLRPTEALPGGVGMALKAMVAYAGTFVTGRAAVFYYLVGRRPTRIELRGMRRDATRRARTAVQEALETLKRSD